MPLQVELVSPESIAYSGEAKMVIARVVTGDIAFLPGHVPFIGILQAHPVRVLFEDGTELSIAVHQGFVEVSDDKVTILSDVCELPDPWKWLGSGALVMTTGLGLPPDESEQCEYFSRMHAAGMQVLD